MPRLTVAKPDLVLVNRGVEIRLSRDYAELEKQTVQRLFELLAQYPKATRFAEALIEDPEVRADWDMADYLAVAKLHFSDHGEVHHKVVGASAASLLQLLTERDIKGDVELSGAGDLDDAFVVVLAAAMLHDIGNQVHRAGHEEMGAVLAINVLDRLLGAIYDDLEQKYELRGFVLHAIRTHDIDVPPLTMEAAIVSVADACDMTKGRSRYAFDHGSINIHTVGGVAIDRVQIERGERKPIRIRVELSNSAGIFPVEQYVLPKVNAGDLAPHVEVIVSTEPDTGETEHRILYAVEMEGKRFVASPPLQST